MHLDLQGQVSFARLRKLHCETPLWQATRGSVARNQWRPSSKPTMTPFRAQRQSQLSIFPKNFSSLRTCIVEICSHCSHRSYICTAMRPGHSWYLFRGASQSEQWQRLYQQKSHNFLEANCYSASAVADLATLEMSFSNMGKDHAPKHFLVFYGRFSPIFIM